MKQPRIIELYGGFKFDTKSESDMLRLEKVIAAGFKHAVEALKDAPLRFNTTQKQ